MSGKYVQHVLMIVVQYLHGLLYRRFTTWTPCSTPVNPTTINISLTSATITWDAVTGTWGYRIRYKKTTDPWSAWVYDTVSTNSYSLTSLSGGTAYQWQVRAMCQQTAPLTIQDLRHILFSVQVLVLVYH